MKTKESIAAYNKEYFQRPDVKARAKLRNAKPEHVERRKEYSKTEAGKEANRRYRRTHQARYLQNESRLKNRYGITVAEYRQMQADQLYLCCICSREPNVWQVDHDHKTGAIRGLLCQPCNMALGLFQDSPEVLISAINHLNGNSI